MLAFRGRRRHSLAGFGIPATGRCLGLHDNATGTISMLDKEEKTILWTDETGDRSLLFGVMRVRAPLYKDQDHGCDETPILFPRSLQAPPFTARRPVQHPVRPRSTGRRGG
jgi:hypothetical protein